MQKVILILLLALVGCGAQHAPAAKREPTFSAKRYDLPDGSYMQTVRVPGNTCLIYTNEKLGRTHMVCDTGVFQLEGPEVDHQRN